jgi:hypothetical protein
MSDVGQDRDPIALVKQAARQGAMHSGFRAAQHMSNPHLRRKDGALLQLPLDKDFKHIAFPSISHQIPERGAMA